MNRSTFEQLCRDASLELGLADTAALGQGFTISFEGAPFETAFREGRDSFVLMMEAGSIAEEKKQKVYANLLTMQLMTWNLPGLRFGFNPQRQTLMQCVDVNVIPEANGAWLAGLVRTLAAHAPQLRKVLDDEVTKEDADGTVGGAIASVLEKASELQS